LYEIFSRLKKLPKYDLVIDIQGLIKSSLVSYFIPSDKTFGFDRRSLREPLSSFLYSHKYNIPYEENVIKRYVYLVSKALNIKITNKDILNKETFFSSRKKSKKNRMAISIVIGASFSGKIYPVQNYDVLFENIDADFLCLWGNSLEYELAINISKKFNNVEVSKKTSISDLIDIVNKSNLVIGGDTGPTHLAWALNVPSITLFGATSGKRNMFVTQINRKLESSSNVNIRKINKSDKSISDIQPMEILVLARKLLGI